MLDVVAMRTAALLLCCAYVAAQGIDSSYTPLHGALGSGFDVLPTGMYTVTEAKTLCTNTFACKGITFAAPQGVDDLKLTDDTQLQVYFKSTIYINADPRWQSYLKIPPKGSNCTQVRGTDLVNPTVVQ